MPALASAVYTCDSSAPFADICRGIADHDVAGLGGFFLQRLVPPVITFAIVYVAGRFLRRGIIRALQRTGGDRQVQALVRNVGTAVTWFFAILAALIAGGVNPAFLLTFGGLASLAIGLAFQDLLRNILAGIWLLVERPFRIGDLITVSDTTGVVQTITLRTTALRTGDGRLAVMPNLTVFSGVVVNNSAYDQRRYTVTLRIAGERDLQHAISAARRELEAVETIARSPAPAVRPQLDSDAILLNCDYWLDYRHNEPDAVMADVTRRLWAVLEEAEPAAASARPAG
ncbi:MAG: mechanosensitive ion channel family protein [Candidatus Dormibacteria bacterium]